MKTLSEIYAHYTGPASWGDKGTVHSYIEVYDYLFAPYRDTAKLVLEIGILGGHSIRMWEDYFSKAEVHGVDLCLNPLDMFDLRPMVAEGTHHLHFFDATQQEAVNSHFGGMKFDVIIEDASHALEHQFGIYANLRNSLADGGIYVIEDVDRIDENRPRFEKIDPERQVRIIDRRHIKERFDDVLVVIGGKQ